MIEAIAAVLSVVAGTEGLKGLLASLVDRLVSRVRGSVDAGEVDQAIKDLIVRLAASPNKKLKRVAKLAILFGTASLFSFGYAVFTGEALSVFELTGIEASAVLAAVSGFVYEALRGLFKDS